jgi:hypothetical protein
MSRRSERRKNPLGELFEQLVPSPDADACFECYRPNPKRGFLIYGDLAFVGRVLAACFADVSAEKFVEDVLAVRPRLRSAPDARGFMVVPLCRKCANNAADAGVVIYSRERLERFFAAREADDLGAIRALS